MGFNFVIVFGNSSVPIESTVERHKMKLSVIFAIILPYVASIAVEIHDRQQRPQPRKGPAILCDDDYCRSSDDPPMLERSLEEMALSPRVLDPKGYKLNVVVFYDDAFAKEFGAKAQDEVKKIIKGTNDIFGHSSLTPKMQVNVDAIEQA